jgi:predicted secreted protein
MRTGIVMATVAVLVLSGCGRSVGRVDAPGATVSGAAAPSGGVPTTVTAAEADNGRTLRLSVGDELVVRLSSTYWEFTTPPGGGAVMSLGPQNVIASAPGAGCVPGAGCGTVTARFRAVAPGGQTISANRTSCGEAMRCTGAEGSYRLYLVVQ